MKIRNGYVSNSSSSSFIILLSSLSEEQVSMIEDHAHIGKEIDNKLKEDGKNEKYTYYEDWYVESDGVSLWCHTTMDNFDLETFVIDEVGVKQKDILHMGDGWYEHKFFDDPIYKKFLLSLRKNKLEKLKNKINGK